MERNVSSFKDVSASLRLDLDSKLLAATLSRLLFRPGLVQVLADVFLFLPQGVAVALQARKAFRMLLMHLYMLLQAIQNIFFSCNRRRNSIGRRT